MLWIGESTASLDTTYTLQEIVSQVQKLTRKDIQEVARRIFDEARINLALIGPLEKGQERILNQLRLP